MAACIRRSFRTTSPTHPRKYCGVSPTGDENTPVSAGIWRYQYWFSGAGGVDVPKDGSANGGLSAREHASERRNATVMRRRPSHHHGEHLARGFLAAEILGTWPSSRTGPYTSDDTKDRPYACQYTLSSPARVVLYASPRIGELPKLAQRAEAVDPQRCLWTGRSWIKPLRKDLMNVQC